MVFDAVELPVLEYSESVGVQWPIGLSYSNMPYGVSGVVGCAAGAPYLAYILVLALASQLANRKYPIHHSALPTLGY